MNYGSKDTCLYLLSNMDTASKIKTFLQNKHS